MFFKETRRLLPQLIKPPKSVVWTRFYYSVFLLPLIYLFLLLRSCFWDWNDGVFSRPLPLAASDELTRDDTPFRWSEITPNVDLQWNDCFESFQCAKLDLPLDWLDPSNETRIALAVIRLEAAEKDDYRGPVFVNPGGPGGSGILTVKKSGKALQTIVGKNHDIISFDPRGVGLTTPQINCYPSVRTTQIWNLLDTGLIDSHPGVLYDAFARAIAYSSSCNGVIGGFNSSELDLKSPYISDGSRNVMEAGPGRFVSTASVARDMLEILNKGGWNKLKYWGFSYGTVLGGYFASMYPDRVERMVNDGNVNLIEWSANNHHTFLKDTDAVMQAFHDFCYSSGPLICVFYASSPSAIEHRLDSLLSTLKVHPVMVPGSLTTEGFPQIISYSSVKRLISTALYRPILIFPTLAEILVALEKGDGLPFLRFTEQSGFRIPFIPDASCRDGRGGDEVLDIGLSDGAFKAIMCSDGAEMTDTVEEFEKYARDLMELSKSAGAVQAQDFRMHCAGWKVRAKWRFAGPFTGNTSHPILYIANSADNVTPLQSALDNSAGFPDSVVLVQEAYGHTSLTAPSICTASHVRAYFQHGILPDPRTRCNSDIEPFQIGSDQRIGNRSLSANVFGDETREVNDALLHLMNSFDFAL